MSLEMSNRPSSVGKRYSEPRVNGKEKVRVNLNIIVTLSYKVQSRKLVTDS